jgi:hypothetical protein
MSEEKNSGTSSRRGILKLLVWNKICLELGYLKYYDDPVTGERTFRNVPAKGTEEHNKIVEIFEKCSKELENKNVDETLVRT